MHRAAWRGGSENAAEDADPACLAFQPAEGLPSALARREVRLRGYSPPGERVRFSLPQTDRQTDTHTRTHTETAPTPSLPAARSAAPGPVFPQWPLKCLTVPFAFTLDGD